MSSQFILGDGLIELASEIVWIWGRTIYIEQISLIESGVGFPGESKILAQLS